jgi:hypothetical protein
VCNRFIYFIVAKVGAIGTETRIDFSDFVEVYVEREMIRPELKKKTALSVSETS